MTSIDALVTHGEATLGDVRIHYVEAGQGPLVILLHGFPDFWYTWRNQIPALAAAGFRVVAPDMRGYNQSSKPRGVVAYDGALLARDIAMLIAHLGEERATVVGHDWGGGVAWLFAMLHPDRLNRLAILNCPHPERMLEGLRTPRHQRQLFHPIEQPVLVIWGERDRYLRKALAEPKAEWVPRCRTVYLPDATHWVQHDEPEAVNRLLIEHLMNEHPAH